MKLNVVDLASPTLQGEERGSSNHWDKIRTEYMKPSTATLMTELMSIGLKSIETVDRETQSAGGDAERAAEKALAAFREKIV